MEKMKKNVDLTRFSCYDGVRITGSIIFILFNVLHAYNTRPAPCFVLHRKMFPESVMLNDAMHLVPKWSLKISPLLQFLSNTKLHPRLAEICSIVNCKDERL